MRRLIGVSILAGAIWLAPACPSRAAPAPVKPARSIVINLPAFRLYLYEDGKVLHDYPVAVGKPITPTPVGRYRLINKVPNPTWHPASKNPVPPGPKNPLGRWWLGLNKPGYGIHGCLDESSIGQAVSKGCIRLHNRDVQQLAALVQIGTPVNIVYEPMALYQGRPDGRLFLWVGRDIYRRRGATIPETLEYLRQNMTVDWDPELVREYLARSPAPGWHELPRAIRCFLREREIGGGYIHDGRLILARPTARSLPGGETLAGSGEGIDLSALALLAGDSVNWRFRPELMTLTVLPARLRAGERTWDGAVRLEEGRVYLLLRAVREALGGELELAADGDWISLADLHALGHLWQWDEAEWEVVAE